MVRREGIALHSIAYWSDVLRTWIGERQKMIVRYDPRDLSRIFLLAPDGDYYDLTYRDLSRPPITLWEQRLALKRLREAGALHIDEAAIFRTIEKMRLIVDEAKTATKIARRQRERRLRLIQGGKCDTPPSDSSPRVEPSADEDDEYSKLPILPFEEWS